MPADPTLTHPYEVLDVFTDTPLRGNALAVFTEGEQIPSRLMQATARELNLSETIFLFPGDTDSDAQARIFTPAAELPFAGHPVLGAAFVLAERNGLEAVRIRIPAGTITVQLTRDEHGELRFGEMEQPIPTIDAYPSPEVLLDALGVSEAALPLQQYVNGPRYVIVVLADPEQLTRLDPDQRALAGLGALGVSCVARGDAPHEFRTRMFGPGLGVAEDPATGSAAGPLAVHLARHGWSEFGQTIMITQGAEIGRRSTLQARVEGSADHLRRVLVGGSAVRVATGTFRLQ